MLWVAEGRRSQVLPIVLIAVAGALVLLFACYGFSPDAFSYVFRSAAGFIASPLTPPGVFSPPSATPASPSPPPLPCSLPRRRRSRYFGNTAPLLCAIIVFLLILTGVHGSPWLWALPFLLTFIGGVLRRRLRRPPRKARPRRRRRARAPPGNLLRLEPARTLVILNPADKHVRAPARRVKQVVSEPTQKITPIKAKKRAASRTKPSPKSGCSA